MPEALFVDFSPDRTRIAFVIRGSPPKLRTANIDGSGLHDIGPVLNVFAWRPDPPPAAQDCPPVPKSRLSLSMGWLTAAEPILCWTDIEGAASYDISGNIHYWPDCEAWLAGLAAITVPISATVPPASSPFTLPETTDPRFPRPKEGDISIRAKDAAGDVIARDGMAWIREEDYSRC